MKRITPRQFRLCGLLTICALALPVPLLAKQSAHVHGQVKLNVALEGKTLSLQLEAPLDSLLGFEHRPRTAAQRAAADSLLKRMNDGAALFRPDATALCSAIKTSVESPTLTAPAPSEAAPSGKEPTHADLDLSIEFNCEKPDQLGGIDVLLFEAFKNIQRVDVQVAGAKGQAKQSLKRPDKRLKLRP